MKKLLSLVLALTLVATAFSGCGAKADSTENTDGTSAAEFKSEFNLSEYFDDNGFFKDVKSSEYVTLPDYHSVVVPKENYVPTTALLDNEVASILSQFTTTETLKEGVVADGDTLNIDYVGSIDGVEFASGSTGGYGTEVTIGVTNYIDGFLPQLIGHKVGENFDIEVTFPEDYDDEDLKGKDAVFNITINSIIKKVVPELTDEFCKENFTDAYNTVDKFMAKVEEELSREMVNSYLYTTVFNNAEISEVPAVVTDFVKTYLLSTYEIQAANYGYSLDDYLGMLGFASRDEFTSYFQADVDMLCEDYIIFTAIAEAEGYKSSEKEVKEYFETYLGTSDYSVAEDLYGMPYLKFMALQTDMLNFLIDTAERG